MPGRRDFGKLAASLTIPSVLAGSASRKDELETGNALEDFSGQIEPGETEVSRIAGKTLVGRMADNLIVKYPEEVDFERVSDPELYLKEDKWPSATRYIEEGFRGDCDGYSIFNTSVFLSKNSTDARSGVYIDRQREEGHAWTELKYEGEYWATDVREPGEFYPREVFIEEAIDNIPDYLVSDQEVLDYHWNW